MFEKQLAGVLNRVLGEYVAGLDHDALSLSVWKGDLKLDNLRLKPEALAQFNLPITVCAGLIGQLQLSIPWQALGRRPVVVKIDRVYLLARTPDAHMEQPTAVDAKTLKAALEAKLKKVLQREEAWVTSNTKVFASAGGARRQEGAKEGGGWLHGLVDTILGNLQVSIRHVHVRFEAEPLHAVPSSGAAETVMALGLTMQHLSADSVDAEGKPTFDVGGLAARLYKHAQLDALAVYFDPAAKPLAGALMDNAAYASVSAADLIKWFEAEAAVLATQATHGAQADAHLMRPVSGTARYSRRGNKEQTQRDEPAHTATLSLQQVWLRVSDAQLHAAQSLAEVFSLASMRAPHAHLRPHRGCSGVRGNARAWWVYGVAAVRQRAAARGLRFSEVLQVAHCRRRYLPAYKLKLTCKKLDPEVESSLASLEAQLDESTLVLFRCVVRTQVAAEKRQLVPPTPTRRGWFGLGGSKEDKEASSPKSPDSGGSVGFTAADLSQLADVFSMDADVGKASDDPLALLYIFKVEMQKAALQLVQASDGLAIVDGCMTDLHGSAHLFPTTKDVRLSLGSYYIDVPEGRLLASSPGSHEALTASVVLNPHQRPNTQVVRAKVAPCLVSVTYDSVGRLSQWVRPKHTLELAALSNAMAGVEFSSGSPAPAAPAAAAAAPAATLDLQVELSAPKVRMPVGGKYAGEMQLVLDLGRFELKSKAAEETSPRPDYDGFRLEGSHISAGFFPTALGWEQLEPLLAADQVARSCTMQLQLADSWPLVEPCHFTVELELLRKGAAAVATVRR